MFISSSKIIAAFKSIFGHKHRWLPVAGTNEDEDAGIGMPPIKHCKVVCSICGAKAIQTTHSLYGTSITDIHQ